MTKKKEHMVQAVMSKIMIKMIRDIYPGTSVLSLLYLEFKEKA